ncbi:hypothetical protein VST7929_00359 [Vibrio stylophorae]|uniref:DUF547 domain-containing protein n=1 Tax=Vibrio stylophorae TaxID=659351 RepID=A0ABM8ZQE6_9VIBR|nr:DUF547 domain-containing protein [Vibrio stylophorae]CAH0532529.1 hypothetical protein VST7929_00359 [Vibrio stylophorae]
MRIGLAILFYGFSALALAAPKADLWSFWQPYQANSTQRVDHQAWQQILNDYLVISPQQHNVNYQSLSQHRAALDRYITRLSQIDPRTLNRNQQFAYWVNLYNALTVQLILDHYPVSSIRKIGPWYKAGPWDEKIITIAGQKLTLNDIEHRILRPIWRDPRIHYVVNCASLGCPDLPAKALNADTLNEQLEHAASRFINSNKGVELQNNQLQLSQIYDWYGSDFGDRAALLAHLAQYNPQLASTLLQWSGKINYDYNWQLNDGSLSQ